MNLQQQIIWFEAVELLKTVYDEFKATGIELNSIPEFLSVAEPIMNSPFDEEESE